MSKRFLFLSTLCKLFLWRMKMNVNFTKLLHKNVFKNSQKCFELYNHLKWIANFESLSTPFPWFYNFLLLINYLTEGELHESLKIYCSWPGGRARIDFLSHVKVKKFLPHMKVKNSCPARRSRKGKNFLPSHGVRIFLPSHGIRNLFLPTRLVKKTILVNFDHSYKNRILVHFFHESVQEFYSCTFYSTSVQE